MQSRTDKQQLLVYNLAQRRKRNWDDSEEWIDPDTDAIPWREATQEQKNQVAAIRGVPLDNFFIRRLSKGEANRTVRDFLRKHGEQEEPCPTNRQSLPRYGKPND